MSKKYELKTHFINFYKLTRISKIQMSKKKNLHDGKETDDWEEFTLVHFFFWKLFVSI
jgi:hypothetical protein